MKLGEGESEKWEREEGRGEDDSEKFQKTLKTRSNKTRQEQVQSKQYNPRHSI